MPDTQQSYMVFHDVPHVRQPESYACWFACLTMLARYWRERGGKGSIIDPGDHEAALILLRRNQGINWSLTLSLIRELNLKWKEVTDSPQVLYSLLQEGPVIFAGIGAGGAGGHWVVFRGMCSNMLWISDPRMDSPTSADYLTFMNQAPPWSRLWICA